MSRYTNLLPYELELRLKHFTDCATTELTSIQNERTLASQSAVNLPLICLLRLANVGRLDAAHRDYLSGAVRSVLVRG